MATANSIVRAALRLIQVKESGEPLDASEAADGLETLNDMIESWTNQGLMQNAFRKITFPFVANQGSYTFGPGGEIDTVRSVSIQNAFTRDRGNADWEMEEINSDQYSRIVLKNTGSSYPLYFYYRPSYPLGQINFWPIPSQNLTLHMNVRDEILTFSDINEDLSYPPGYIKALKYNLALEIAPEYRNDFPPLIKDIADSTLEAIKDTNNKNIPELVSPLARMGYNWSLSGLGGCGGCEQPVVPPNEYIESGSEVDTIIESGSQTTLIVES